MKRVAHRLTSKIRTMGLLRTLGYVFFTVFLGRFGLRLNALFSRTMNGGKPESDPTEFCINVVQHEDDFSEQDLAVLLEYGGKPLMDSFLMAFTAKKYCVTLRSSTYGIATVCWMCLG